MDEQREARQRFGSFLKRNPKLALNTSIGDLVRKSGITISDSAAYRVARRSGFREGRRYRSKYDDFWSKINWQLPDTDLSQIWGVERGNLQSKRKMLMLANDPKACEPRWNRIRDVPDSEYRAALAAERRKKFHNRCPIPRGLPAPRAA